MNINRQWLLVRHLCRTAVSSLPERLKTPHSPSWLWLPDKRNIWPTRWQSTASNWRGRTAALPVTVRPTAWPPSMDNTFCQQFSRQENQIRITVSKNRVGMRNFSDHAYRTDVHLRFFPDVGRKRHLKTGIRRNGCAAHYPGNKNRRDPRRAAWLDWPA